MLDQPLDESPRSELSPEFLGVASTNPFANHNSSSRLQMFCSHIGQSLVVKGATLKRCQTGVEREFAKYTFNIKMPCNATILRVIQKYPKTIGDGSIRENPLTLVIYENADSPRREIGVLELTKFHWIHQYYGFEYHYRNVTGRLVPGASIPKDTIIADSPQVTEHGDYTYGLETKVAMMSMHLNIEDGVVISESYAERLKTTGFGSRTISWGKHRYPLNLKGYGTPENPKAFPDIGDRIRPDGLLTGLREYDDMLAVVDLTPEALQVPDYNFDRLMYAEPNAKIIDVVIHQGNQLRSNIPTGLSQQCENYMSKTKIFYKSLLDEYNSLKQKRGNSLVITPQLHRWIVEANAICNDDPSNRVTLTFNRNPMDEWRVEVFYKYEMKPSVGAKITDCHGGKGVVVAIWPDEKMPVDKHGNRAEVIVDDSSTIKRMNIGRLYEQYINAASDYITRQLPAMLGSKTPEEIEKTWLYLLDYYRLVSPVMYNLVLLSPIKEKKLKHIEKVIADGIYLHTPTDTPSHYRNVIREICKRFPDIEGPVTYTGDSGVPCTTKDNVLIGSMYILMLEKTGNTQAAVASAKLQHYGIPSKATNEDKYSGPGREQPIRLWGEAEVRLCAATCGGEVAADILDQTNNPAVHREIVENILHAAQPSNIQRIVDRVKLPMGGGRMHSYVNHFLECAGTGFVRRR